MQLDIEVFEYPIIKLLTIDNNNNAGKLESIDDWFLKEDLDLLSIMRTKGSAPSI